MGAPRIYAYREARLLELADAMTESVLAGNLCYVARGLAEGHRSTTARATLAALVACKLHLEGHDGLAAAFLLLVEQAAGRPERVTWRERPPAPVPSAVFWTRA